MYRYRIVSVKHLNADGKAAARAGTAPFVYVGRACYGFCASPLGNPRLDLPEYRNWLIDRVRAHDAAVTAALRAIEPDSALVCWCATWAGTDLSRVPCHAGHVWYVWQLVRDGVDLAAHRLHRVDCDHCHREQLVTAGQVSEGAVVCPHCEREFSIDR